MSYKDVLAKAKVQNVGLLWEGMLNRRSYLLENKKVASLVCENNRWLASDLYDIEKYPPTKFLKNPKDIRKTPVGEFLSSALINSSAAYYGLNDKKAADFAIQVMKGYAKKNYPRLNQKKGFGHTIGSAGQVLLAASSAYSMLQSYEGFTEADRVLIADWLQDRVLSSEIYKKRRSGWSVKRDVLKGT